MGHEEEARLQSAIEKFAATHLRIIIVVAFGLGVWMARIEYNLSAIQKDFAHLSEKFQDIKDGNNKTYKTSQINQ